MGGAGGDCFVRRSSASHRDRDGGTRPTADVNLMPALRL